MSRRSSTLFFGALSVVMALGAGASAQVRAATHVVERGETLSQIAALHHVSTDALVRRNRLGDPDHLRRGQVLRLPTDAANITPLPAPAARHVPEARPVPGVRLAARSVAAERSNTVRGRSRWGRPRRPGVVTLVRFHTGERISADLRRPGRYRRAMRHFLRASGGAMHDIDPRLLRMLAQISDHFGGRTIRVVSAFRPFRRGQYTPHSNHNHGRAIDFRVDGVPNRVTRDFCRTLPNAGCGYYPRSVFIHMDARSERASWVDWSRPGERPRYGSESHPPADNVAHAPAAAPAGDPLAGADAELEDVASEIPAIRQAAPEANDDQPEAPEGAEPGAAPAAQP